MVGIRPVRGALSKSERMLWMMARIGRHVVRLYEVYETPDNVLLVLENCPCGDLEKMLYMRG